MAIEKVNGYNYENYDIKIGKNSGSYKGGSVNKSQYASRGAAWDGFEVPAFNGTGELSPRTDSGLDYYA